VGRPAAAGGAGPHTQGGQPYILLNYYAAVCGGVHSCRRRMGSTQMWRVQQVACCKLLCERFELLGAQSVFVVGCRCAGKTPTRRASTSRSLSRCSRYALPSLLWLPSLSPLHPICRQLHMVACSAAALVRDVFVELHNGWPPKQPSDNTRRSSGSPRARRWCTSVQSRCCRCHFPIRVLTEVYCHLRSPRARRWCTSAQSRWCPFPARQQPCEPRPTATASCWCPSPTTTSRSSCWTDSLSSRPSTAR